MRLRFRCSVCQKRYDLARGVLVIATEEGERLYALVCDQCAPR